VEFAPGVFGTEEEKDSVRLIIEWAATDNPNLDLRRVRWNVPQIALHFHGWIICLARDIHKGEDDVERYRPGGEVYQTVRQLMKGVQNPEPILENLRVLRMAVAALIHEESIALDIDAVLEGLRKLHEETFSRLEDELLGLIQGDTDIDPTIGRAKTAARRLGMNVRDFKFTPPTSGGSGNPAGKRGWAYRKHKKGGADS
jgi:hypothetical protein